MRAATSSPSKAARAANSAKVDGQRDYNVGTLSSALKVLDQFALREMWSLGDLVQAVGQPKSRVFRFLRTFEEAGYVTRDEVSGDYKPGPALLTLSSGSLKYEQLRWRALPPLQALSEATGETAHVGILFGREVVTVQLVEGSHEVRMHSRVGKRSPVHASSLGKVLLAYFPEPEIDAYLRDVELKAMTPNTIVDPERFKQNLREIRRNGFAIDDEELELGLCCVAAPVTDHTSMVVAALSISAPTTRLKGDSVKQVVPTVVGCARTVSRMLGSPSLGAQP